MSEPTVVRPHTLTLTDEVWRDLVQTHGKRGASAALENAYRASRGMSARPAVEEHGRWLPGQSGRKARPA